MVNITTQITAGEPRFVMPTCADLGVSVWAATDASARTHVTALVQGASQGTSVWSSPPG